MLAIDFIRTVQRPAGEKKKPVLEHEHKRLEAIHASPPLFNWEQEKRIAMDTGGKVPHFKLKPDPIVSIVLALVLIAGVLIALSFFSMEDGTGTFKNRGALVLIITALLSICLTIVATSKMWFSHLWKKNSTHARHKKHTKYHPIVKEREFREQR